MADQLDYRSLILKIQTFFDQKIYEDLGAGIAQKKRHVSLLFRGVVHIAHTHLGNALLLIAAILFYDKIRRPGRLQRIFEFGLTSNNIRVFNRLNDVLQRDNIRDVSLNGLPISFVMRLRILGRLGEIICGSKALFAHRHENPFIHLQQTIGCAALVMFSSVVKVGRLKIICIASDHAPTSMALMSVARMHGIATCYVQHAPVTEFFPPLNYDLSILFDRASHTAYKKAAEKRGWKNTGEVVFLSPFKDQFCHPNIDQGPYTVGVCLSYLADLRGLEALLSDLSRKDTVSKILLRRHPRCRRNLFILTAFPKVSVRPQGESAEDFFKSVDLVLVPSSGVAVESLHRGLMTFYTSGVDMLADDYYGFVRSAILPRFDIAMLDDASKMRGFFDYNWTKRFALLDETINTSEEKMKEIAINAFHRHLEAP